MIALVRNTDALDSSVDTPNPLEYILAKRS